MRKLQGLTLYHYHSCPYCIRVRNFLERSGLEVELADVRTDRERYRDLVESTGRSTVPVLRIEDEHGEVRWLPESLDIIRYLEDRAAAD